MQIAGHLLICHPRAGGSAAPAENPLEGFHQHSHQLPDVLQDRILLRGIRLTVHRVTQLVYGMGVFLDLLGSELSILHILLTPRTEILDPLLDLRRQPLLFHPMAHHVDFFGTERDLVHPVQHAQRFAFGYLRRGCRLQGCTRRGCIW